MINMEKYQLRRDLILWDEPERGEFNSTTDWKILINSVRKMIDLEMSHLEMLETRNAPKSFIKTSKEMLGHYKQRLLEYQKYNK